ncbi:MAG: hypothetical protein AAF675_11500 [Pseudomonadota bacterium]
MPIEFAGVQLAPGESKVLTFQGTVVASVVGIRMFELGFKHGQDRRIETVAIRLSKQQAAKQVTVTAELVMVDEHSHGLDPDASYVVVAVVAVTDTNAGLVALGNERGMKSGGESMQFALPNQSLDIFQGVLSGFDLSYGSSGGDHSVQTIAVTVGESQNGTEGVLTATAQLHDQFGSKASELSVDGGFIAQTAGGTQLRAIPIPNVQTTLIESITHEISPALSSKEGVVLITGFRTGYGSGGRFVHRLRVGTLEADINLDSVVLKGAGAYVNDHDNYNQDNAVSHVDLLLVTLGS